MAPNFGLVCVLAAVTAAAAPHHLRHGTTCAGELVMFDNRYHPPVPSKGSIGSQSYWWRALAANQLYVERANVCRLSVGRPVNFSTKKPGTIAAGRVVPCSWCKLAYLRSLVEERLERRRAAAGAATTGEGDGSTDHWLVYLDSDAFFVEPRLVRSLVLAAGKDEKRPGSAEP